MKLATWNVNSLKVRLPHVIDWLKTNQPDMLCLQETKLTDENFPVKEIAEAGYESIFAGQKTYNGVAILSKQKGLEVVTAFPDFVDEQKRIIAATFGDLRIVSVYVPNGESVGSDKYDYKMRWLPSLTRWLQQELKVYRKLALLGDFNIAPEDRDVHDPELWEGKVLCSQPERSAFWDLLKLGLSDSFRSNQAAGIAVLKKAIDLNAAGALALIEAIPDNKTTSNLPPHLGQHINTTA